MFDRIVTEDHNVGREDRLVRGCLAITLVPLALFGLIGSGRVGITVLAFTLAGCYFAVTALRGWDPMYARFGMDTRAEAIDPTGQVDEFGEVDLRDPAPEWGGISILGGRR